MVDTANTAGVLRVRRQWRLPAAFRGAAPLVGIFIIVAWIVVAVLGPAIWPSNPDTPGTTLLAAPSGAHWFGTDELGRDVFSRVLAGGRITFPLAVLMVVLSLVAGGLLGIIAGYLGGWIDEAIMRITDLFLAFPGIILAMVVAAALGPSLFNAVLAGVIASWPNYCRVARSIALGMRDADFVRADRLLGYSAFRALRLDVVPSVVGPLVVLSTLGMGQALLLIAALSFLGLGAAPPTPDWGFMVADAINYFNDWWLAVFPGLAILSVVMAFNFVGDALRDVFDPRTRGDLARLSAT